MRTIGPPPPLPTAPNVTSEYCFCGGAMLHTPDMLWPAFNPMASPPAFRNPKKPGNGYQRSPSSNGFSAPAKFVEVQVPDEVGAGPVDQDAMVALVVSSLVE